MNDGTVQLTTDVYLKPIEISSHSAWPKDKDGPIRVRRAIFASEVFLFVGTDNMTVFKLTDPEWNGTHARDVAPEDVYDLSKLKVTFDLEQTGGVIQRFNGTEEEVLPAESANSDDSAQNGETGGNSGSGSGPSAETKWSIANLLGLSLD